MPKTLKNNFTPQAVDDLFDVGDVVFRRNEDIDIGIKSLDLTQNDRGGNSKTFLGLGNLGGELLDIADVGEIRYDFETDSFTFNPAQGFDGGPVSFEYAIQMGNGVVSSAVATFEAAVQNKVERTLTFDDFLPGEANVRLLADYSQWYEGDPDQDDYGGFDWHFEEEGSYSSFSVYSNEQIKSNGIYEGASKLIDPEDSNDDILKGYWRKNRPRRDGQGTSTTGFTAANGEAFDLIAGEFSSFYREDTKLTLIAHNEYGEKGRATFELSSDQVDYLEFNTEEFGETFVDITKVTFEAREYFGGADELRDYGRFAADDIVVAQEPIAAV